jgi:hypothetical protein
MGLMNLFRPKWKHSDSDVRQDAVKLITDHTLLAEIAQQDDSGYVRCEAVRKLTDQALLAKIAQTDDDSRVRENAVRWLTDQVQLAEVVKRGRHLLTRMEAASKLADQELVQSMYAEIARTDDDRYMSLEAVWKLTDKSVLAELALNSRHPEVRRNAVSQLKDQSALIEVVRSEIEREDTDDQVCAWAAGRITDKALLAEIAWTERSRADKLVEILDRFSQCAQCGEWCETEKLDWKHRCGGCSGAS